MIWETIYIDLFRSYLKVCEFSFYSRSEKKWSGGSSVRKLVLRTACVCAKWGLNTLQLAKAAMCPVSCVHYSMHSAGRDSGNARSTAPTSKGFLCLELGYEWSMEQAQISTSQACNRYLTRKCCSKNEPYPVSGRLYGKDHLQKCSSFCVEGQQLLVIDANEPTEGFLPGRFESLDSVRPTQIRPKIAECSPHSSSSWSFLRPQHVDTAHLGKVSTLPASWPS